MNKGTLIYRDKSSIPYLYGIIVGVVVVCGLILFAPIRELTFNDISAVLFLGTVFLWVSFLCLKKTKENPGFYEHGIGYFENNKLVRFENYTMFSSVECYFKRNHSHFKAEPEYGLIFYHLDGSSITLTQRSVEPLKELWGHISSQNPMITQQLTCQSTVESASRIHSGCLSTHFGSELLYNVLKKTASE